MALLSPSLLIRLYKVSIMYRDRAQWTKIRRRILVDQIPIRQVVRETGISRKTIRKMLASRWPQPYGPRSPGNSEPPPCTTSISRAHPTRRKPDKRAEAKTLAFDWMRSVLQKQIALSELRHQTGDPPELVQLLRRLYDGRLTDRNRSMVILANRHGLTSSVTCSFLGIDRHTCRGYLRRFGHAGVSGLFAQQTKSNRKFDNEAIKNAVFGLLHEPPSNYGINRTTWTIGHLSRTLRETRCPVGPGVIRKITRLAGYRWRKARIVLTSNDPAFSEKLDRVRSILAESSSGRGILLHRRIWSFCCEGKTRSCACRSWRAASRATVAEISRLLDLDGGAGAVGEPSPPLF